MVGRCCGLSAEGPDGTTPDEPGGRTGRGAAVRARALSETEFRAVCAVSSGENTGNHIAPQPHVAAESGFVQQRGDR